VRGKRFELLGRDGPERALTLVQAGQKNLQQKAKATKKPNAGKTAKPKRKTEKR
jgi:hypothetical protein